MAFLDAVTEAIKQLAASVSISPSRLAGVGIGAPGLIDAKRGLVHHLVNVAGWREVPLAATLSRRLHCRCAVDNDVNLITLGEWRAGAGRGVNNLVCLTLGTGVGGGIVMGGRLQRGVSGSAGEIGHTVLDPKGRVCACGNRGCLESFVSTRPILRQARGLLQRGDRRLSRAIAQNGGRLTPEVVSRVAATGGRAAQEIWNTLGFWLGVGIGNIVNALNPERVIIGGGVSQAWVRFIPAFRRSFRKVAMQVPARAATVTRAKLGDTAGIIEASMLIRERMRD